MKTREELLETATRNGYPTDRIAVAGLLFDKGGRLLLMRRGEKAPDEIGKLEGFGGRLGEHQNMQTRLLQEAAEEIPEISAPDSRHIPCNIEVGELIDCAPITFDGAGGKKMTWLVVTYLCFLHSGTPGIGEPQKVTSLHWLTLNDFYRWPQNGGTDGDIPAFSPWTTRIREIYRQRYGDKPWQP